jgi:hypothetical protein
VQIEAQSRCRDDLDVEPFELQLVGSSDALESLADDVKSVLGGIEEHTARSRDREAAQTLCARGDGDGEVESQEALTALRLSADQTDGLFTPQRVDEPAVLFRL